MRVCIALLLLLLLPTVAHTAPVERVSSSQLVQTSDRHDYGAIDDRESITSVETEESNGFGEGDPAVVRGKKPSVLGQQLLTAERWAVIDHGLSSRSRFLVNFQE